MLLKPYFDGIGTGAGVAWPLFGIIASAIGLGVGGSLAIILGSTCGLIFFIVAGVTCYISHKKFKDEEKTLKRKLYTNLLLFINNLYVAASKENRTFEDYINDWASDDLLQVNLVNFIKNNNFRYAYLSPAEKTAWLDRHIDPFIQSLDIKPPVREVLHTGFVSFMGVFGSVAGCSAGMMGVFAGLGAITGFGAFPLLAAVVLILAVGLGIYGARQAINVSIEHHAKKNLYKNFKSFNKNIGDELGISPTKENKQENEGITLVGEGYTYPAAGLCKLL
jgi:hypothetical protein